MTDRDSVSREPRFDGLDLLGGTLGNIGDSSVFDFSAFSVGLADEGAGVEFVASLVFAFIDIHSEY